MTPLPPIDVLLDAAHVVSLPMRVRFRGVVVREVVLLQGTAGWGEFAPFAEYGDEEAAWWLASAVESAWQGHPRPVRDVVRVNATVPAVPAEQVAGVLDAFQGCTTAKVKVAERRQSLADDVARVAAVRDALGPAGLIRVDANGAWDVDTAVDALTRLAASGLEYAEQPCASLADLRRLRTRLARAGVDVPIAADESIRKADDPFAVAASGAVDVAVVKVAPLGGARRALAVAEVLRRDHDLPVVISSALDSSVGIAAGVAVAAALPELPYACGLATAGLLADDVTAQPLLARDGVLPVRTVLPDTDALARLAASPERRDWWRARLTRCHALLGRRAGSGA